MAISVFPVAVASTGPNANAMTIPSSQTAYKGTVTLPAAVYTITTSPTTSTAYVTFDAGTTFPSTQTVSGTVTYNLASEATNVTVSVDTGTNVVVTINRVANSLSGTSISGTLDTVTTTSTYNTTGKLFVLVVGGGGGGGGGENNNQGNYRGSPGGAAGGVGSAIVYTNNATSITIGAAGNAGTTGNAGGDGGATSFGNFITANGGSGGKNLAVDTARNNGWGTVTTNLTNNGYIAASSGGYGGRGAPNASPESGAANNVVNSQPITVGHTNGGGGGGGQGAGNNQTNGGGSGIGTGGRGGWINSGTSATAGSGYGAGGGGGLQQGTNGLNGGAGSAGVVYVLRGF